MRIVAKGAADIDAAHVGEPHIDHDQIGLRAAHEAEKLATGVRAKHGIAMRSQNGFQGTRGPFVLVGEQNERRSWGETGFRHAFRGIRATHCGGPVSRCGASRGSARNMRCARTSHKCLACQRVTQYRSAHEPGGVGHRRYICDVIVRRGASERISQRWCKRYHCLVQLYVIHFVPPINGRIASRCARSRPLLWRGRHRLALSMLLGSVGLTTQVTMP